MISSACAWRRRRRSRCTGRPARRAARRSAAAAAGRSWRPCAAAPAGRARRRRRTARARRWTARRSRGLLVEPPVGVLERFQLGDDSPAHGVDVRASATMSAGRCAADLAVEVAAATMPRTAPASAASGSRRPRRRPHAAAARKAAIMHAATRITDHRAARRGSVGGRAARGTRSGQDRVQVRPQGAEARRRTPCRGRVAARPGGRPGTTDRPVRRSRCARLRGAHSSTVPVGAALRGSRAGRAVARGLVGARCRGRASGTPRRRVSA